MREEQAADELFVIDELSRRTGITVRSLRDYHSRRLLQPPIMRGRTGYYDGRHVARVELVKELQAEGLKLEAVGRMIEGEGTSDRELITFARIASDLYDASGRVTLTQAELAERFRVPLDEAPPRLVRAEELGLVRHLGDEGYIALAPGLLDTGSRTAELFDLSLDEVLDLAQRLREQVTPVADLFLELFADRVLVPLLQDDNPKGNDLIEQAQASLKEIHDVGRASMMAIFELVMTESIQRRVDQLRAVQLAPAPEE